MTNIASRNEVSPATALRRTRPGRVVVRTLSGVGVRPGRTLLLALDLLL